MLKFRTILTTALLTVCCLSLSSQSNEGETLNTNSKFRDKLVFGGNVGASFGNVTLIEFSPTIGYKVTPKFISGVNLNFIYFSDRFQRGYIYGPGVFARYNVFEGLFLHTEFQQSYSDFEIKGTDFRTQTDFPMFLVGGGYSQSIGGSARIGFTVLIDLIEDPNSFYQNPIIRGGVLFGL